MSPAKAVRHVALLRAVNVAGHGKVSMEALRALFSDLGLTDVRTLLNSGNVVFGAAGGQPAAMEKRIEAVLNATLDLSTELFVRSAAEWDEALAANPFRAEAERDPARLVILALKTPVGAAAGAALKKAIVGREAVHVAGRHAYAFYPDGQGRSKLTVAVLERALGTRVTGRNWNTALKLRALLAG